MINQQYKNIGKVVKVNRKTAELSIHIDAPQPSLYRELETFFIEIDGGKVPFFVDHIRQKTHDLFLVLTEDYHDPEINQRFVGCRVFTENKNLDNEQADLPGYETLIGYLVVDDEKGELGKISDVIEVPEQLLMKVIHNNVEIFIPLVEEFILSLNKSEKSILVNLPEGLVDLYLND